VAITPFADSLRFGGTMELAGLDLSVTSRRVHAILNAVPRYLANLDTSNVQREGAWSGLRPVSPDGLPYIGRFTEIPNLIMATGHAMLGVTLATGTGKLVAQIISGEKPFLPLKQFNPERFS
jgi:D-amino-acid dehydrogenase